MPNPYFTNTLTLQPFTRAKSVDIETKFAAVEAAFDGVNADVAGNFARVLRTGSSETLSQLPAAGDRANKALGFDATGDVIVQVVASSQQMTAAVQAATDAAASATAAAASATEAAGYAGQLTGTTPFIHQQLLNNGTA